MHLARPMTRLQNIVAILRGKRIDRRTAEKAAQWWADRLDGTIFVDTGNDRQSDIMTSTLNKRDIHLTDAQRSNFVRELARIIQRSDASATGYMRLGVDYDTCYSIAEALHRAGLSTEQYAYNLPMKTTMYVTVHEGIFVGAAGGMRDPEIVSWGFTQAQARRNQYIARTMFPSLRSAA